MFVALFRTSALVPGLSEEADQTKAEAKQAEYEKEYVRGSILDRNGQKLAWTEEPGGTRQYMHAKAFSHVLGYQSKIYGNTGIEKQKNHLLVHSDSKRKQKKGADLTLTLDADLQKQAYELIKKWNGSVVILDAKTGEILTLASSPSYDLTKIDSQWEEINQKEGVLLSNAYQNPVAPGSIFKVVTAKAILEQHLENETVEDKGSLVINGQTIRNYNGTAYGSLDFMEGFVHSSNVYFMDRGLKLGKQTIQKNGEDFLLGEKITLDFTTISSTFSVKHASKNELAVTCFGQGNTLVTPLQMAMITQSVANKGTMMKSYLFHNAVNGKGEVVYEGTKEEFTSVMEETTANGIREAMIAAAKKYGLTEKYGQIAAKTGTAQRGDGTNNAWMISFAPAEEPRYVIVANRLGTKEIGKTMAPVIEALYKSLLKEE